MSSVDSYIRRCLCHEAVHHCGWLSTASTESRVHDFDGSQIQQIRRHVINIPTATSYSFSTATVNSLSFTFHLLENRPLLYITRYEYYNATTVVCCIIIRVNQHLKPCQESLHAKSCKAFLVNFTALSSIPQQHCDARLMNDGQSL